jgi:HEPN domain-containing protein
MRLDPPNVLLKKAREDEHLVLLVVNDASVADEQIGFFCQQRVEKSIKAVLSARGIKYRRTHDIAELIDLLKDNAIAYPSSLDRSITLTPFATEMRYDYLPPEQNAEQAFDRASAVRLLRGALEWALGIVEPK